MLETGFSDVGQFVSEGILLDDGVECVTTGLTCNRA
jgi:hypothetical protein